MTQAKRTKRNPPKSIEELWAIVEETEKQIQKTSQEFGRLMGKWGIFLEYVVSPGIPKVFKKYGIKEIQQRLKTPDIEIDIMGIGEDILVAVEVKSTLGSDDIDDFLKRLSKIKENFPKYKKFTVYGAVAGMDVPKNVSRKAYQKGLFVLGQSGDTIIIQNDEKFKPRAW